MSGLTFWGVFGKIIGAREWRELRAEYVEIAKIARRKRENRENSGVFREKCLKTPLKIKLSVQKWPFCPLYVCKKDLFCVKKWQNVRFLDEIVVDKVKNSGVFRRNCSKTPLNLKKNAKSQKCGKGGGFFCNKECFFCKKTCLLNFTLYRKKTYLV